MRQYIQMLSSTWEHRYLTTLVEGISRRLKDEDIGLHIFNAYDDVIEKNFYTLDREIFSLPNNEDYIGMITVFNSVDATRSISHYVSEFRKTGKPVLTVDSHVEDTPFFGIDNYASMYEIVDHMVSYHKCRVLNYIGGPATNEENQLRYRAFVDCLNAHDIPVDHNRIRHYRFLMEDGRKAYHDFKEQGLHLPDCVISANDHMAYGYLLSAREDGYEAPDDFRITGFDNMELGQDFIPSITSINRRWDQLGYDAADGLIKMVRTGRPIREHFTVGMVQPNESCGCAITTRNLRADYLRSLMKARDIHENSIKVDTARKILLSNPDMSRFRQAIYKTTRALDIPQYALCLNENFSSIDNASNNEPFSKKMTAYLEDSTEDIDTSVSLLPSDFLSCEQKIYVFSAVHFDAQIFGYCVMPFDFTFISNGGHRFLMDNISLSLVNIKQRMALNEMNEKLRHLYITDALTGLYNRFAYNEFLTDLHEKNDGQVFVMCMDLDHLKKINDRFGHSLGDKAIKALADAINDTFEEEDIKIRMGGDEFTVIGRYVSKELLKRQEEKIHKHLKDFVSENDFPAEVEASIAYAISIEDDISDLEELTHIADKRMYAIKQEHHLRS
ncbi:MAG: GGDEF domain-containing protein [Lachnospiraceae bacterium]|nr:GGDEF domain-containing protein [Lachnospiraceae bacterium]